MKNPYKVTTFLKRKISDILSFFKNNACVNAFFPSLLPLFAENECSIIRLCCDLSTLTIEIFLNESPYVLRVRGIHEYQENFKVNKRTYIIFILKSRTLMKIIVSVFRGGKL